MPTGEWIALLVLLALAYLSWRFSRYLRDEPCISNAKGTGTGGGQARSVATVLCLQCRRPLRIGLPPQSNVGRCPACGHRFTIVLWDRGNNLYISSVDDEFDGPALQGTLGERDQIGFFLETLGLDPRTAPEDLNLRDVRRAYYKTIQKYHPDKYAQLPAEFRRIAEQKTRELQQAYQGLTDWTKLNKSQLH